LWSLGAGVNKGVNSSLANSSNVTLTNPVVATQLIGFTASGKKLILPAMNAATSPQVGAVIHVINGALETYDVVAADGSTSVVPSLLAGKDFYIEVTSNATSNGAFRTYSYGDLSSTTAAATYAPINNAALTGSTTAQSLLVSGTSTVNTLSITGTGTAVTRSPGDNSTKIATTAYVDATLLGVFPSGIIAPYAGSSAPDGWMFCYGQAVDRTTYASLFTAIGTTYGSGDGSTTFNLPNYTDKMPIGKGAIAASIGSTGGSATTTLSSANLPSHSHTYSGSSTTICAYTGIYDSGHSHAMGGTYQAYGQPSISSVLTQISGQNTGAAAANIIDPTHAHSFSWSGTTSTAGSSTAATTISPYLGINFIIKT